MQRTQLKLVLSMVAVLTITAVAQNPEMEQKLAALKESSAANKARLQQYTWVEIQQANLKGENKPEQTFSCQYGPDGQVIKTPMGAPPQPTGGQGGKLKQRMVAKKKEEMKDYMGEVKNLLAMYVPPNPQRMQAAFQAGNVSFNPVGGGVVNMVFKNYAQNGDQMTVAFNGQTKKIQTVNVHTYLDEPKDVVTLAVRFASLPDGTNYAEQTVLDATAKQLKVTTTNTNYTKRMQ